MYKPFFRLLKRFKFLYTEEIISEYLDLKQQLDQSNQKIVQIQKDIDNKRKEYASYQKEMLVPVMDKIDKIMQETAGLHQEILNTQKKTNEIKQYCQELMKFREDMDSKTVKFELELTNLNNHIVFLNKEANCLNQELTAFRMDIDTKNTDLIASILKDRYVLARQLKKNQEFNFKRIKFKEEKYEIEQLFKILESRAPAAYLQWRKLFKVNEEAYDGLPIDSCSVKGHPMAEMFRYFLLPYLEGRVLDIGCGPQPVPYYLEDYPLDLIYGIDPIYSSEHPFNFVQGLSEFLPWDDGVFNVVIAATSLDHVLLLDRAINEIKRVLVKSGRFIVWVAFIRGAKKYNPYQKEVQPLDKYHLFHFDKEWFEEIVGESFEIEEVFHLNKPIISSFYSLIPRP